MYFRILLYVKGFIVLDIIIFINVWEDFFEMGDL